MGGIQPLLIAQESGRMRRMHEMIEFTIHQLCTCFFFARVFIINNEAYSRDRLRCPKP